MASQPRQLSRSRTRPEYDADSSAPYKDWPEMYAYLRREFQQGDHMAILGPTGTGKTHIALEAAEIRAYVMVIACKPKDPLIEDARARGYWLVPTNKLEVPYVDGRPYHRRVIYWPRLSQAAARKLEYHHRLRAERAMHKPLVGGALGYVRANGHWCIVIDEGTYICRDLNLQKDVDSALQHFRTLNASIIILGQRPAWMGRYVLSQPTHLFLFNTRNRDDRKSLGDISGVDPYEVEFLVRSLDRAKHEALYIDTRNMKMFRTVAPPR